MFDLYTLDEIKIHTEQIETMARRAWLVSHCMPKRLSGGKRAMEVIGNKLIAVGTQLRERAYAEPEAVPSPTFLITL
jgi:hypothetical protein